MRTFVRVIITLIMVALAIVLGIWLWQYYMYTPWTRDARVRADIITIAPDVSGWVSSMSTHDNQDVEKGEVLFRINDERYQAAHDRAQAMAANRKYQYELNLHEYQRRRDLSDSAISAENLETARLNAQIAKAGYQQALAQQESARIDLARTTVTAPADGTIINLQLREGNYVTQGNPQMALVRAGSFYITAYFEETKIPPIDVGDEVRVWLMSGARELEGHVASIGRAIANTNTSTDGQLLPQVQQTFTWVRLAQRIPVDIVLDEIPEGIYLSAGMTASVRIVPEDRDDINRDNPDNTFKETGSAQDALPIIEGAPAITEGIPSRDHAAIEPEQ